ncbi:unnamed protein product [Pieris macdunnoughi]|uniref:Uncharacterized protein n=1 Tax=Pieris macdunnoughi TaxID=345717 RepID=A0A821VFL5_9NEOP|nr:unnamed protein product [Pieris macdunnoughi]
MAPLNRQNGAPASAVQHLLHKRKREYHIHAKAIHKRYNSYVIKVLPSHYVAPEIHSLRAGCLATKEQNNVVKM